MKIEQLNESISDVVYHATTYRNAFMIMKSDEFHMRTSFGNLAERRLSKKKDHPFFMSTMRNLSSAVISDNYAIVEVVFVLDGRKLSQKYKGLAVSYFSSKRRRAFEWEDEMEDRLVSKNRVIKNFSKYIKEIFIVFEEYDTKNKYTTESKRYYIRKIVTAAKQKHIPVEVYGSIRNLMIGKEKMSVSDIMDYIKQSPLQQPKTIEDEAPPNYFSQTLRIAEELANKDRFYELGDDARYDIKHRIPLRPSKIDSHMSTESLTPRIERFIRTMRRHKWYNSEDIVNGLAEKWGRIIAVLDSYNAARGIMPTKKKDQLDYVAYNPEGALEALVYNDVKIFRDVVDLAIELNPENKAIAEEAKKKGLIKR